ncbi:LysR family glycine cleavage system transcriptional activator [Pelomonas saccharophila]|uniref:LysR family glycine cleavage system transcriptional activator n=1 Tax=Roseateles saccharophilus TaxID=304 RepID=A0ABU1YR14_ROSSA|nr:LysR substrate-binding domain-containing protein [Roseateles saccharophilus]MDR7271300.1 LysR family glycine cleavage system transcriptional activator [Roseateles saccharophilus]
MASLDRFPLHYLAAFRAAAQTENLRAAAESLHLTHSAVSQQIRGLETALGFEVFTRQGRRLVLNPAGQTLQRAVSKVFAELQAGLLAAGQAHGHQTQMLRITSLPSFAQRWLMPRLPRWQTLQPCITLDLHTGHQVVDLEREGYQIGLRVGRGPWPGLATEPLFHSPMIAVAAPALAHKLIGRPGSALADEPLLGHTDEWQAWFVGAGINATPVVVASFNDAGVALQAGEQGMGVVLARELLAADALLDGRLVRVHAHARDLDATREYQIVYPEALRDDPAVRAFCDWLHAEIAALQQRLTETAAVDR